VYVSLKLAGSLSLKALTLREVNRALSMQISSFDLRSSLITKLLSSSPESLAIEDSRIVTPSNLSCRSRTNDVCFFHLLSLYDIVQICSAVNLDIV
jgi:hypothetical protein